MQNSRTCTRLALGAALAVLAAAGSASALDEVPLYHVTRMGPLLEELFPGVQYPGSRSRGLNENGDLVGEASTGGNQIQGWIYTVEHGVVALPLVGGFTSNLPLDISERDANGEVVIVGGAVPNTYWDLYLGTAALWRFSTVTGEVLESRQIPTLPGFDEGLAIGVNNDGTVVGYSSIYSPFGPFKYDVATGVVGPLDFPVKPAAINNAGQIVGGRYRGDLLGNYVDLGIPPDCTSLTVNGINDLGWVAGRAGRPFTDGAGHWLVSVVRLNDAGWLVLPPYSHLDDGRDVNTHGDVLAWARLYIEALGEEHWLDDLLAPPFINGVSPSYSEVVNDNGQVAAYSGDAILLTPLGVMVIPGDVNGDIQVNLDDYCAWVANPIDLDGDGDIDGDDEQWLIDRLLVFGYTVEDCNGNGAGDHCDIVDGLSADCDGNDVPDECQPDCSGDGVPDVCEPDCNGNATPDPCDIANGTSEDCNANGIPDECDGGGVTEVMVVHDPPLQILQSDFIVDDTLVVDAGIIEDVDLYLDIRYRIGDLTVLLSHGDTTITILDRPGHPEYYFGFVNLGYDAIIDDEGTGPYLENAGDYCCNFEWLVSPPSYRPDTALSNGLSAFDGMPSEGIWSLTIMTTDTGSPGEGLLAWGLTITRASVPVPPCNPADLDQDGTVGILDFLLLLAAWGPCGDCANCPADLDGDCNVGVTDFLILLANWT